MREETLREEALREEALMEEALGLPAPDPGLRDQSLKNPFLPAAQNNLDLAWNRFHSACRNLRIRTVCRAKDPASLPEGGGPRERWKELLPAFWSE